MDKNQPKNNPDRDNGTNNYVKYSGVGFQMIAIIGAFTYAGYRIDKAGNHKTQWATAALALIGVFISLYIVIRAVRS